MPNPIGSCDGFGAVLMTILGPRNLSRGLFKEEVCFDAHLTLQGTWPRLLQVRANHVANVSFFWCILYITADLLLPSTSMSCSSHKRTMTSFLDHNLAMRRYGLRILF